MKTDIMGIAFDNVTMQEALDKASAILRGDKTCYAVTPNAEIAYEAMKDESLRGLINGADLVLPDGAGVVLASKLLKTPLKQKVAGVDFADGLLGILAESGRSVYLLGSKPGVAELAAEKMREKHPGLIICGMRQLFLIQPVLFLILTTIAIMQSSLKMQVLIQFVLRIWQVF